MYLKHACLYKRRQQLKKVKRRVTLNRFDAILRCNSLIIKMARLRFPGRPRHRIGKNYVKFAYDDVKMNMEACMQAHNKIEVGLKLFYELFGYSDEEEEFDGFSPEDLAQADAIVALKLKQKRALHRYLESNQELSSSGASEIERILSSDSDSSGSSARQKRGMRDITRKPYDKLLKGKLEKPDIHTNITNHEQAKQCLKSKSNIKRTLEPVNSQPGSKLTEKETPKLPALKTENHAKIDCDMQGKSKAPKKTLLRHLLEKTKHEVKVRRRRKRSMRPNVKKKFRKNLMYSSKNKYSPNLRKTVGSELHPSSQIRLRHKSWSTKIADAKAGITSDQTCSNLTSVSKPEITKVPHSSKSKRSLTVGRKRFILPSMSARSSRKIIPRRRYMDEYDQPSQRALDEESQGSRSSLSGSSEAISAMDGGSSPDDSRMSEDGHILHSRKKVGILDRPLIVEGKRPWKPSLKVQMKLSEMKLDYPFALKKNMDGSSGTSSGSFKDIIKPDMVSKYAEKMAQKPKEKPLKLVENVKKSVPLNAKSEPVREDSDNSDALEDSKKPEDKLEKVAAKIEKLLKSQWEGRLKDSTVKPSANVPSKFESNVVHWKNEQQQRSCSQKRTKSILRKARLQLKRRNLNLRTRQSDKQVNLNIAAEVKDVNSQVFPKNSQSILPSLSVSEQLDVPSKNVPRVSVGNDCASASCCSICGFAKICGQSPKLYDQITCDPCNKFFESFAKSPKQYFCIKKGNCNIDSSKENVSRRVISARCKACWLKVCMEKLTVSTLLRDQLIKYIPRLDAPPHNPLLTDNVAFFQEPITFMDLARSAEEDKTVGKNTSDSKIDQINFVSNVPKPFDTFANAADDEANSCIAGEQHSFSNTDLSEKSLSTKKETSSELSKSVSFDSIPAKFVTDFNQGTIDEFNKLVDSRKLSSATDTSSFIASVNGTNVTEKNASPSIDAAVDAVAMEEEAKQKGPRIKHVCRRAAVVLGLPRATFSDVGDTKEPFFLSALPEEEKQKILETVPQDEKQKATECTTEVKPTVCVNKTFKQQVKKKLHKDVKVKNRVHLDLLKKSSLLIQKEQKRRKLLMKKSMKHLHKHSFKKSLKLSRRSELKKTLKFSYKSAVKTSLKSSPKVTAKRPPKVIKCRKVRCKQCEGCLAEDCGQCAYCLDKKKFGGPNLIKQACMFRRCLRPVAPASERRSAKTPQTENIDKSKPSGGHSSFGGDGPSGIGTSLTSSSSSPSSPDGSSCGSSCSSSSTTSSSGSSGSSSSSSSGSSSSTSSTSSSDNVTVPDGDVMGDSCAAVPFMHSIESESVLLQESECIDNNVVTNPLFPDTVYDENDFSSDLDEALLEEFALSQAEGIDSVENESVYRENDDTILYEETSSIIELKNASFAPSLMYSASLDDNQSSVSTSSYTGSRNQNSRQSGSGYKKSFYSKDQDQYGSAGSGGQDSNEEDDDDEGEFQKKHFIYADYWENYDFDKISCQGFALISSQQIPLQCVCYLCGSAGEEKLIFCVLCCEPYHTFCLSEDDVPHEENIENWCCKRCQCCAVCGLKNNLLKCRKCQNAYHAECLAPQYPTKPSRKKRIWMCPKCVKCKSCGTTSPASGAGLLWNFDLLLCQSCAKLTDKGNYCPVCHKCYEENDYDSEMVQCYKCCRWVHAKCDNMSDEDYQVLSCLPETVVYTCIECTVEPVPLWRNAIKEYLKTKLRSVFSALMSSKCILRLIRHDSDFRKLSYIPNSSEVHKVKKLNEPAEKFSIFSAIEKDPKEYRSSHASASTSLTPLEKLCEPIESGKSEVTATVSDLITKVEANSCSLTDQKHAVDFMPVKYKLERGRYKNIESFFEEVIAIISKGKDNGMALYVNAAKAVLKEELKKVFPWFKLPVGKLWRRKVDFPDGMLPNAVVPPTVDHTYSQYLERTDLLSSLELSSAISLYDSRSCVLCGYTGDSTSKKCGRLLYCGQDDWIHVNCAIWSAEVFEQENGSLRNVHPAIARGKLMSCEFCNQMGATVGCCVRGCPANYHFYCARKDEALLQADRKVFCALHKDNVDAKIIKENDFPVLRRINVSQTTIAPKWVKKLWKSPMDKDKIQVLIGSLKITKLGHLTALSNGHEVLIPVNYECTRIFWSTKNPRKRVKYMCRIVEMQPDNYQWEPHSITHRTIVHSENSSKEIRLVASELDSNQDVQFIQISEKQNYNLIENIILNDVKIVLNRLIRAVVKQLKKSRKHVNHFHAHDFKHMKVRNNESSCDKLKTNNNLWLNGFSPCRKCVSEGEKSETKVRHSSTHDNKLESLLSVPEIENNIRNCKDQVLNSHRALQLKASSTFLNSEKNKLNPEIYKKENDFKKLNKLLLSYVLNEQNLQDSEKLMHLIAEKEITKEIMERFIHQNKGLKTFPDNMLPLLKSVLPPCSVSETVLPVFNVDPKENRMTESSGYSSNDDSHFKHSSNIRSCAANNNKGQPDSVPEMPVLEKCILTTNESESLWKKLKLNGKKNFGLRCSQQNATLNCDTTTGKTDDIELNSMLDDSNIKIVNGISLSGPFKCNKCKRLYRTEDSFKKHSENCNFFLDSSSADEDSTSSESSEETFERQKNNFILNHNGDNAMSSACNVDSKNDNADVMKYPNRILPSQNLSRFSADLLKTPAGVAVENPSFKKSQVNSFSAPLKYNPTANQTENKNKVLVNQNKVYHNSINHQSQNQTFSTTSQNQHILPQNSTWDSKRNLPEHIENSNMLIVEEQRMPPHFQISEQPGPQFEQAVQDTFVHSVPMNVNNLSIAAENISSYNIGYSNTVCNNSGLMQLPCNTLVIPPQSDGLHQSSSIISQIQVPQNNFLTAPVELTQNAQLSYVGSITITNNETMSLAVNVPDQIVPIFPSNNVNFGPTTLIPSPLQMQQTTGIHLSTVNVQQISLQGSFASNSLSPFIYPQQTVTIPQNQVMILEEPMSHPNPQPNYLFQVPVEQSQNCTFPSILPQQQISQQFTNQIPFGSISQNQVNGVSIDHDSSNIKAEHFQSSSTIPVQPDVRLSSYSSHLAPKPCLTQNETNCDSNIVCGMQSLDSRSSPTGSTASSTLSSEMIPNNNDLSVASKNNNIVSILKKAAEQMLNLSAEMSKRKAQSQEKPSVENLPEKKTRFAHTRKVAARTAEKLKKKKAVLNGNIKDSSQPKTKSLHLNIAALKPAFTIPIVPVTSLNKDIMFNSMQPPVLEAQNAKVVAATSCNSAPYGKASNDLEKELSDSDLYSFNDDDTESILLKIHMRDMELKKNNASKTKPYIMYEIQSEDGFNVQSDSLKDAWKKVYEELQDARIAAHMKNISVAPEDIDGFHMLGLDSPALTYLLEQLPGAEKCADYNFTFHKPGKDFFELPENASGCARSEIYTTRREYDMFSFLASEHRDRPIFLPPEEEEEGGAQKSTRRSTLLDLPIAMRFKNLKSLARETVGVYRSSIHGRGLFCKRNIDPGELVIEYAGEVVRSVLTDKRERIYQSKGIGCYMFRIDDDEVVDATMHGNAARFINHSCEPNCFSKVITVDGKKHIVIFALRRIIKGEELTYDYKFPFEEEKIPCHCNSRRCRKYLN